MRGEPQPVCASSALANNSYVGFDVVYRGEARKAIVVRHQGIAYAYLNQCVHMPRTLDCEQCNVFDESGRYIRCTMHGLIYEPDTGMCRSDICAGESLTALKIDERDGTIFLIEKHGRCHLTPA